MRHRTFALIFLLAICLICGNECNSQDSPAVIHPTENINDLKAKCIKAAVSGILRDIQYILRQIEKYDKNRLYISGMTIEQMHSDLKKLTEKLIEYKKIGLDSYQLPGKKEIVGWTHYGQKAATGLHLQYKNMSKSGPFYVIVGINGDNYDVLVPDRGLFKPDHEYLVTMYPVCPSYSGVNGMYVYIDSVAPVQKD